jgi:hypothetical protein
MVNKDNNYLVQSILKIFGKFLPKSLYLTLYQDIMEALNSKEEFLESSDDF